MMHYSFQPKDRVYIKGYRLLSFLINMGKNIGKNISNNLRGKCSQKRLDHDKQSAADALELRQKGQFKKHQKQLVIWLVIKLLIELRSFQKIYKKTILRQLQMNMIKEHLKVDISPEERYKIIHDLRLI